MPAGHDTTIPDVTINREPRQPVEDPTLGIPVVVDRTGVPANRLVTIGDSLTHGFMSGAISRTDRSWPALVARELGLGAGFRYPTYEPADGPGGLPIDIERLVRGLGDRVGNRVDWHEMVGALRWARRHLDRIEDYWERGDGTKVPTTPGPYHNLAVYGADLLDVLMLDADIVADRFAKEPPNDSFLVPRVDRDNDRAWRVVLESCRDRGGVARTVVEAAGAMGEEGVTRAPGDGGTSHGIETLVVVLGANHALGSVVRLNPKWTSTTYGALDETRAVRPQGRLQRVAARALRRRVGARGRPAADRPGPPRDPGHGPAGHDRPDRPRGRREAGAQPLLPPLHPAVDRRRRVRPGPRPVDHRRRGPHDRLGDRRLQRGDHRLGRSRPARRPRLVRVRHGRPARQPGVPPLHRRRLGAADVVAALPAAARAGRPRPGARHPLLPVGPRMGAPRAG